MCSRYLQLSTRRGVKDRNSQISTRPPDVRQIERAFFPVRLPWTPCVARGPQTATSSMPRLVCNCWQPVVRWNLMRAGVCARRSIGSGGSHGCGPAPDWCACATPLECPAPSRWGIDEFRGIRPKYGRMPLVSSDIHPDPGLPHHAPGRTNLSQAARAIGPWPPVSRCAGR